MRYTQTKITQQNTCGGNTESNQMLYTEIRRSGQNPMGACHARNPFSLSQMLRRNTQPTLSNTFFHSSIREQREEKGKKHIGPLGKGTIGRRLSRRLNGCEGEIHITYTVIYFCKGAPFSIRVVAYKGCRVVRAPHFESQERQAHKQQ